MTEVLSETAAERREAVDARADQINTQTREDVGVDLSGIRDRRDEIRNDAVQVGGRASHHVSPRTEWSAGPVAARRAWMRDQRDGAPRAPRRTHRRWA